MFQLLSVQVIYILIPLLIAVPVPWTEIENLLGHEVPALSIEETILPIEILPNFELVDDSTKNESHSIDTRTSVNTTKINQNDVYDSTKNESHSIDTKTSVKTTSINKNGTLREIEEITDSAITSTTVKSDTTTHSTTMVIDILHNANQEEESEEESEEEMDFVQSLVSTFLSGLSTDTGGVDVDAVLGLIGGLSVPNDDGTYDFSGLTETLQSFFGPDAEGGSDIGPFIGGLLSAAIQGVAVPPGAKGAGNLVGQLLAAVLPALSGPAPPVDGTNTKPEQGLDSAGFFQGFIKSSSAGSSGGNSTSSGSGSALVNIKQTIFKTIFSFISSLLTKPSKNDW